MTVTNQTKPLSSICQLDSSALRQGNTFFNSHQAKDMSQHKRTKEKDENRTSTNLHWTGIIGENLIKNTS
jgi:hypothetical protein